MPYKHPSTFCGLWRSSLPTNSVKKNIFQKLKVLTLLPVWQNHGNIIAEHAGNLAVPCYAEGHSLVALATGGRTNWPMKVF